MSTATKVVPSCRERDSIAEDIRKVIATITEIHNAELEAVLAGELTPRNELADHRLRELRELKVLLMERLFRHCREHGC